jgi:hypothetical protein
LGPEFKVTFGNWRGDRLGFHCWNDATDGAAKSGYLDVDWFRYRHDREAVVSSAY